MQNFYKGLSLVFGGLKFIGDYLIQLGEGIRSGIGYLKGNVPGLREIYGKKINSIRFKER
ncbi:hypothetical protein A2954_04260 [Candidatus Roizmanbacteria bacterium RIFCSPLOWO2_01_FULL_37_12]|uniref:Uncharacterized protein n=1 Tax=Candidatus Roizmanbacteria bacterium RIFCSPLOWO2_01_FULL_37_12 TaxID=1802056 RepID=A0A1F7IFS6_9BACT|nr:MAG: hypothetical protein A3D76_06170 [Candidatus Roizmanbacteria bacterium RIFCSPHIGHO2_02_FULL_37_9b]OGK42197.1 MAG: hypothetical protein A2954_04260 [Candidatus Roizmanbacteria bacterium RIFCSPLOWO2_01_FULL_37_12]